MIVTSEVRFLEKKFIITNISHIIMVGKDEYSEKKSVFTRDLKHNEIIFKMSGESTVYFNGTVLEEKENTIRFLPAGKNEGYEVHNRRLGKCIDIFFDTDRPIADRAFVVDVVNNEKIGKIFQRAFALWVGKEEGYYFECLALIYRIFAEMQRQQYAPSEHAEKIRPAVDLIREEFLKREIRTEELCRVCGISESYLKRLFREQYGMPPKQYLLVLKIDHACDLLETERYTVTQVAELCHFSDVYYFSRQFKAKVGITPTQFVQKYRSSK